jgi:phenylalanyl-tRNA synthetase beta chain
VLKTIQTAVKPLATSVQLFDVYTGDKLLNGQKSLAFSITFQAPDRTLTDADITAEVAKAVTACTKHYGATLRDS